MAGDFSQLEAYCSGIIASLQPAERRQLARRIATDLRQANAKQIAAQLNPDGTRFAPRKLRQKKGSLRRSMFAKLRLAKWLKTEATPSHAVVSFANHVQRIAQVHHYGLRDRVFKNKTMTADYPERQLLGFNASNIDQIKEAVLIHLAR